MRKVTIVQRTNISTNVGFNIRRRGIYRKIMEYPSPFDIYLNDIDLYEVDEEWQEKWKEEIDAIRSHDYYNLFLKCMNKISRP